MAGTFTNLLYHLVFSTKNREPLIVPALRDELYPYIGGILHGEKGILLEVGGTPDHVHLVAKVRPDIAISDMLRLIKGNSSKWVNERTDQKERFEWQAGYGAFTASESQCGAVREYVRTQVRHHHKATFQEEFVAMLERHQISYDARYIWQ